MILRNPAHQSQIRYSALLVIKKELSSFRNLLRYFECDILTQLETIRPDHLWTQSSEVSRDDVNINLRVKLEQILNTNPREGSREFYDSVHAVLMVLALYWPRNEFGVSDIAGDIQRPKCPLTLEPINIEDRSKVYIFSDGRLYSDAIFHSIVRDKNPLTNLRFLKRDLIYNKTIKDYNDLQTMFPKLKQKWRFYIGSAYLAVCVPAAYVFSRTLAHLLAESSGFVQGLNQFALFSLFGSTICFGTYFIGEICAKISLGASEGFLLAATQNNKALLLFEAIEEKLKALMEPSQSTVKIHSLLSSNYSSEIKMDSSIKPIVVNKEPGCSDVSAEGEEVKVAPPIPTRRRSFG